MSLYGMYIGTVTEVNIDLKYYLLVEQGKMEYVGVYFSRLDKTTNNVYLRHFTLVLPGTCPRKHKLRNQ